MKLRKILSCLVICAMVFALIPENVSAKSITLKNTDTVKTMAPGSTFLIETNQKASKLKFKSSKKAVATVTEKGLVQAKKKGTAIIRISSGKTVKKLKVIVKKPVGYSISKKAGTYQGMVQTTVKAQKGYTVYYTISGKFKASQKILAKKSKTFTFSSTKTLKLYPVKKGNKMTMKTLNRTEKKSPLRNDYLYTVTAAVSQTDDSMPQNTPVPDGKDGVNASQAPAASASSTPAASETPGSGNSTDQPAGTGKPTGTDNPDGPGVTPPGDSEYTGDDSDSDYVAPVTAQFDEIDRKLTAAEGETSAVEIVIPSEKPSSKIKTDTYEISTKNKLTIQAPGTYVLSTAGTEAVDAIVEAELDGVSGLVHIVLNGVNLKSTKYDSEGPDSDTGLITIKKSVSRAVITLQEGSVNTFTDTGVTGIDKDDGVSVTYTGGIVCKKTPLTINGRGELNIVSKNGNGIKATDSLKILDAKIGVEGEGDAAAGHNGITGKTGLFVENAALDIYATGDGLKTTLDETDISGDSTLAEFGNMSINGGIYRIVSTDGDAISVYRTLNLTPKEMTVQTMNQSGSTEDGSYKAIKAGTTIYIPEDAGTITANTTATYNASRAGGESNDPYADDTIHCGGYIKIDGGTLVLAAGDDGIHSDKGLVINGGSITISQSYEGIESGDITINGGTIAITARDDGMNAAGGADNTSSTPGSFGGDNFGKGESATVSNYQIIITGGTLTVDASGDGIDSNGNIFFQGGTVTVNGPTNGGNGALDYGDQGCVCEISGGTLIAAGAVGMDTAPTSGSSQPAVNVRFSSVQSAGTYVVVKDGDGKTVMTAQPTKQFQSVVLSCEGMTLGNTYTIYYGNSLEALTELDSVTFTSVSMSIGSGSSGGWMPGGPGSGGPGGH